MIRKVVCVSVGDEGNKIKSSQSECINKGGNNNTKDECKIMKIMMRIPLYKNMYSGILNERGQTPVYMAKN